MELLQKGHSRMAHVAPVRGRNSVGRGPSGPGHSSGLHEQEDDDADEPQCRPERESHSGANATARGHGGTDSTPYADPEQEDQEERGAHARHDGASFASLSTVSIKTARVPIRTPGPRRRSARTPTCRRWT